MCDHGAIPATPMAVTGRGLWGALGLLAVWGLLGGGAGCKGWRSGDESSVLPRGADPADRQGPSGPSDPRIYQETRPYMGTLFRIVIALSGSPRTVKGRQRLASDRRRAESAAQAAFREVVRLEKHFSSYLPESDISRINQAARATPTQAVKVPQEVYNLIHRSRQLSAASGGAFDITYRALAGLYRRPEGGRPARLPNLVELRRALGLVGHRHLVLDREATTVRLAKTGVQIDLGAVAKGYTVDQVVRVLRAASFSDFIVDGGGDLYVAGRHPERAWQVGIKDPRRPHTYFATLPISDRAVVTSGDYERYFLHDKKRYHHILDPRTGRPARGLASVTVVAREATLADALATAAFVLGPRKGLVLLARAAGVEGLLVTPTGQVLMTAGLKGKVKHRRPTPEP